MIGAALAGTTILGAALAAPTVEPATWSGARGAAVDDLALVDELVGQPGDEALAELVVLQRVEALSDWVALLQARAADPRFDADARLRIAQQLERVRAEERAWRSRLAELSPAFRPVALQAWPTSALPQSPATHDVVGWLEPVVVERGQRVRHAVALGADVVVLGTVEGHVTSLGGAVRVVGTGRVLGDQVAWGGVVEGPSARHAAPLPGPLSLAATALGALGIATLGASAFPAAVQRLAREVARHPVASVLSGLLAGSAFAVGALLAAGLLGAPLLLLAGGGALVAGAVVGFAGALVAVGEVVLDAERGPRRAWGVAAAVVACLGLLAVPPLFRAALLGVAALGLGATLRALVRPR